MKEMFMRSEQLDELKYTSYVEDEDSETFKAIHKRIEELFRII